jgi:hypothetical protein
MTSTPHAAFPAAHCPEAMIAISGEIAQSATQSHQNLKS